jgi:exopolyphosphatase/guanosine-5'-triphosphate,3'-diphosphate pyrophosphatase
VAALDCGTNSTRLLVVGADGATRLRLMRITRLGQGVDEDGRLRPEAMERTVRVLQEYRMHMDAEGVGDARLVCTSAVRDAANGEDFLRAAAEVVGVPAELLSGEEEGRAASAGARSGLPPADGDDLVVDVGGGSTELALDHGGQVRAVSLDIGCVRVTERLFHHDPPTPPELGAAEGLVDEVLAEGVRQVPELSSLEERSRLIGVAGSVTTLAALQLGLAEYDAARIHHSVLTLDEVAHWCNVLAAEPAADRARRGPVIEGRQDVIVGGALILRQVMRRFGFTDCLVSESDILDGLALGLLGRTS